MKYVIGMLILIAGSAEAGSFKDKHSKIINTITKAAKSNKVPVKVMLSICYVESTFKVTAFHEDDGTDDSIGLCQIQLTTARSLGFKYGKIRLFEPSVNAYYASKYLKSLIKRYGTVDKAIVAYNLGHYSPKYKKYINKVYNAMEKF